MDANIIPANYQKQIMKSPRNYFLSTKRLQKKKIKNNKGKAVVLDNITRFFGVRNIYLFSFDSRSFRYGLRIWPFNRKRHRPQLQPYQHDVVFVSYENFKLLSSFYVRLRWHFIRITFTRRILDALCARIGFSSINYFIFYPLPSSFFPFKLLWLIEFHNRYLPKINKINFTIFQLPEAPNQGL